MLDLRPAGSLRLDGSSVPTGAAGSLEKSKQTNCIKKSFKSKFCLPFSLMRENYRQIWRLSPHQEYFFRVGSHVTLLEQGSPQLGPLGPLGDLLLGVIFVVCVGP